MLLVSTRLLHGEPCVTRNGWVDELHCTACPWVEGVADRVGGFAGAKSMHT